jgi:hypothetical protein
MPTGVIKQKPAYLHDAQRALHMNLEQVGALIGVSKRTAQRMSVGRSDIGKDHFAKLASHVYGVDPELASELARLAGGTLVSLGIVAPPPPPSPAGPPPPPPVPRHLAADAVVCVAAESMNVPPAQVRAALLAAFRRSRELGLTCEEVERALGSSAGTTPA